MPASTATPSASSQLGWMFFLKIFDDTRKGMELTARRLPIAAARAACAGRNWATDAEGITGEELLDFVNNELFPRSRTCTGGRRQARAAS